MKQAALDLSLSRKKTRPSDVVADASARGVIFGSPKLCLHPARGIAETVIAQMQAELRRRILRAFVGRGLLERCDSKDMLVYQQHSGLSVDAGVCIEAHDRAGLERLLRYCARPPFARDRLRKSVSTASPKLACLPTAQIR